MSDTLGSSTGLSSKSKDQLTKEQLKGIVYKVSCRTCPYIWCILENVKEVGNLAGQTQAWNKWNVGSTVKQHAEITGHDIHLYCAKILETGANNKSKRLFLESLHSFLDKNSVKERATFLRVYVSLVASLGDSEQYCLTYLHSVTACRVNSEERRQKGVEN